jgi:mitogen-activated protein kinase 1/3
MVSQGSQPSQADFFGNAPEARKYRVLEIIGKGSYGLVASAIDLQTNQKVAIKKIINVFDHVSDSTRILREIKLLRLLKHPGVWQIELFAEVKASLHCSHQCILWTCGSSLR